MTSADTRQQSESVTPLRDSQWAMRLFGYDPKQKSAFWQRVHASGVPYIRTGRRKVQFDEQQVRDWLDRRSTGGAS